MPARTAEVTVAAESRVWRVEDPEHARHLADGDRGEVPGGGRTGEQGAAGRRTVRDDRGPPSPEGEREADGALDGHGVVPLQLQGERDPRDAYVGAPPGRGRDVPLLRADPVGEGGQRQLDQVAEVATLTGHQPLVATVDVGEEQALVAGADRLHPLVEQALLQATGLLGTDPGGATAAGASGPGLLPVAGAADEAEAGEQHRDDGERSRAREPLSPRASPAGTRRLHRGPARPRRRSRPGRAR